MIKLFLLFLTIVILAARSDYAQSCELTDLSKKFNYRVAVVKTKNSDDDLPRISEIRLQIISKTNKKRIQRINVTSEYLFQDAYTKCAAAARSYVTGKNAKADATDNDYGDFIVADFNFDGKEDFAVKRDSGGNGGAFYQYYTQNKRGAFQKDSFLTEQMGYFPGTIDARKKRLITYIHANVSGYNENIYKYNSAARKWTFLKQTYRKAGR